MKNFAKYLTESGLQGINGKPSSRAAQTYAFMCISFSYLETVLGNMLAAREKAPFYNIRLFKYIIASDLHTKGINGKP